MNNVLLLGSGGFLGRVLKKKMIKEGMNVVEYDKISGEDIFDIRTLEENVSIVDVVINASAIGDLYDVKDKLKESYRINVDGAEIVAKTCKKLNKVLIHISTTCIYGNAGTFFKVIDERTMPAPTEEYAEQKLLSEKKVLSIGGLEVYVLRLATMYGEDMRKSMVFHRFLESAVNNEPVLIHGSGNQKRTYTHVDDIADGIISTIKNIKQLNTGVYVLSAAKQFSLNEIIHTLSRIHGGKIKLLYAPEREGQIYNQPISSEKFTRVTGWNPKHNVIEDLELLSSQYEKKFDYATTLDWNEKIPYFHRISYDNMPEELEKIHLMNNTVCRYDAFISKIEKLKNGIEKKKLIITFDDGYRDVLNLKPFFDENNDVLQPVFFINTETVNDKNYVNWTDYLYRILSSLDEKEICEILDFLRKKLIDEKNNPKGCCLQALVDNSSATKRQLKTLEHGHLISMLDYINQLYGLNIKRHEINRELYLDPPSIRNLVNSGWILGSHGKTHQRLTTYSSLELLKTDLLDSLIVVKNLGGNAWLSFPDGKYDMEVVSIAREVGFTRFFTLLGSDTKKTKDIFVRNEVL